MAETNRNAATAQAIRRSNSVILRRRTWRAGQRAGDDRKGEAGGQHQDRRSLHSVDNSHGTVEQPEASDSSADLSVGRAGEPRAVQGCGVHGPYACAGRSTESMTWMTPFEASMSVSITLAWLPWPSVISTPSPSSATVNGALLTVGTSPASTSAAMTSAGTT